MIQRIICFLCLHRMATISKDRRFEYRHCGCCGRTALIDHTNGSVRSWKE